MARPAFNILILCTGNSARSIMAEALFNVLGEGRFNACSAGSHPTGGVHPLALEQVEALGYPLAQLRSKSWEEFARPGAPAMDFVITVCDNAAAEPCPIFPGHPTTAHWGFEDPAGVHGTDHVRRAAFSEIFQKIQQRVRRLVRLPLEDMSPAAIQQALRTIGEAPAQ